MSKDFIETLRALVAAANSLRFNPEIDPDVAALYESRILIVKAALEEHPEIITEARA